MLQASADAMHSPTKKMTQVKKMMQVRKTAEKRAAGLADTHDRAPPFELHLVTPSCMPEGLLLTVFVPQSLSVADDSRVCCAAANSQYASRIALNGNKVMKRDRVFDQSHSYPIPDGSPFRAVSREDRNTEKR
jgi:hypothetical protein